MKPYGFKTVVYYDKRLNKKDKPKHKGFGRFNERKKVKLQLSQYQ